MHSVGALAMDENLPSDQGDLSLRKDPEDAGRSPRRHHWLLTPASGAPVEPACRSSFLGARADRNVGRPRQLTGSQNTRMAGTSPKWPRIQNGHFWYVSTPATDRQAMRIKSALGIRKLDAPLLRSVIVLGPQGRPGGGLACPRYLASRRRRLGSRRGGPGGAPRWSGARKSSTAPNAARPD